MSDLESYEDSDSSIFDTSDENEEVPKVQEQYPLKDTWTVYDHVKSDSDSYDANTRVIGNIGTIIEFWKYFNHYPKPSSIFNNGACKPTVGGKEISSISVFKKGIKPKWEDKVNKMGAEVSKRRFDRRGQLVELDSNWFELLMACIGNSLDSTITGIRVVDSSSKKRTEYRQEGSLEYKLMYRIELWFSDVTKREVIENQFKNILNLDPKNIYYKEHSPRTSE